MYKNPQIKKIVLSGYTVFQPNSDDLVIEKSWKESIFPFILIFAFFILWYYGILSSTGNDDPNIITRIKYIITEEPALIIFLIVPIFILIPILYKLGKKVFNKEKYIIDGNRGTIMKNNRLLTSFADIAKISIAPQNSELIIELKNSEKISIIKSKRHTSLKRVAEIISKLTKISISK